MYTIELSYVLTISMLAILYLVNGTIQYHQELYHFSDIHMEEEVDSHRMGGEKQQFQPEKFMRMSTLLESWIDESEKQKEVRD